MPVSHFFANQVTTARIAAEQLLELITPVRCMRCLREDSWLCSSCTQKIIPFSQRCIVCEQEEPSGATCIECSRQTNLDGIISGGAYVSPWLRRGIGWLKFKGVRSISKTLAHILIPELTKIAPVQQLQHEAVLIPIPLHAKRFQERGFNQSEDIANAIHTYTNIPISYNLIRKKATHIQTQLPHELRQKNIQDAFLLTEEIPTHIRFILLVDDVITTGSTVSAAAGEIPHKEDYSIWAVSIARG